MIEFKTEIRFEYLTMDKPKPTPEQWKKLIASVEAQIRERISKGQDGGALFIGEYELIWYTITFVKENGKWVPFVESRLWRQ